MRRFLRALSLLVAIGGLVAMLYPAVAGAYNNAVFADTVRQQNDTVAELGPEVDEAWKLADDHNKNLAGDPVVDPFEQGQGYVIDGNYEKLLNINGDGVMGSIEIPKIRVNLPILHGTSEDVLKKGVGHIEHTSVPVGGPNTHSVLTAHRGLPEAAMFTELDALEDGDQILIRVLGRVLAYRVTGKNVVDPTDINMIRGRKGEDLLTLVTCTPYGVNSHRLLVHAERTEYVPDQVQSASYDIANLDPRWYSIGLLAVVSSAATARTLWKASNSARSLAVS